MFSKSKEERIQNLEWEVKVLKDQGAFLAETIQALYTKLNLQHVEVPLQHMAVEIPKKK